MSLYTDSPLNMRFSYAKKLINFCTQFSKILTTGIARPTSLIVRHYSGTPIIYGMK